MEYTNYQWVDTASGGAQNRNNVQNIRRLCYANPADCYRTYFRYPDEFSQYVKKHGSVKGYNGFAYADWFPIDIDRGDLTEALKATRDLVERLKVNFDIEAQMLPIFFSGAKGFHVYIPSYMFGAKPSRNIGQYFKLFASLLMKPWGVEYDSSIYETLRLFRANGTINAKTGLYKTQITYDELYFDMDGIKALAIAPRRCELVQPEPCEALVTLYKDAVRQIDERPKINGVAVDSGGVPRYAKVCYHTMLQGVKNGQRDEVAIRLATHFKKQGYDSQIAEGMLAAWDAKNESPLGLSVIRQKINSAFAERSMADYGCNDDVLKSYCSNECFLKQKQLKAEPEHEPDDIIFDFQQTANLYKEYVKNLASASINIGFPVIGKAMRGISPGEVCTIVARSGVGKTAVLVNILMRAALSNKSPQIFFSMEQPAAQIFERMAQIATGLKGEEVEKAFQDGSGEEITEKTAGLYNHVLMVEKDFLTVDKMIEVIKTAEEKVVGQKIGLVAIDYLGRMGTKNKDSYQALSENAQAIKHLAKELNVAVIQLAQVNRAGKDGTAELSMEMIRDSGQIEEASDFVIGMWRPDMQENSTKVEDVLRVKLLKNRKGVNGIFHDFKFVKNCLRVDDYEQSIWMDVEDNKPDFTYFGKEVTLL